MSQNVLLPGWDNLSPEQKTSAKDWVKSLIKLRVASRELLGAFSNKPIEAQPNPVDELLDCDFEVVDSSVTSDGIRIEEIIPLLQVLAIKEDLSRGACHTACLLTYHHNPELTQCIQDCP